MLFGLDPAWIALIGTIIATVGVKILERWLGKKDRNSTDAAQIRSELREQITTAKEEIRRLEDELDEWRAKYYEAIEELVAKRIELQNALDTIRRLTAQAQIETENAQKIINDTP